MDSKELKRLMITEYEEKIDLYQRMVAEWKRDLGESATAGPVNGSKKAAEPVSDDLLNTVHEFEFFNKTQPEAARIFLERVGYPVKTETILQAIMKGGVKVGGTGTLKDKKMNFYTILHRADDFTLFEKNTWGLTAWPGGREKKEKEKAVAEQSEAAAQK